ncbi:hypothetical protein BDA96_10G200100 [Sorghum bicolor]|uniref:Uncharacterized protein n=2 Tax=Sorghum bicolor TaxID=4558 RepID=A0A921Q426_SORBI|nr:hypothetical protein BDA96_10G200100 [Sorghum bicolor]KAG0514532.1 hypothetical protein BDA96_10G200100 [Sorghum bicolor]KAG0514533.1 hypothetical protein BDA96_10G200100 [Sorghum bicolor]KXG20084.1 hypothetical protein SORBI_3010G152600 [Sorghum bicolor]KXG20085.1 hypothetical protein SORBI_3010G152600 [Sorghum bicolor]
MAPGIALPVPDAAGRARAGSGAGANVEAATLLGSRRDAQVGGAREEDPAWAEVAKLAVRASSSTGVWAIGRRTSASRFKQGLREASLPGDCPESSTRSSSSSMKCI